MLKLAEACPVYLPEFKVCDETKKQKLIQYCVNNEDLNMYLPDKEKLNEISRSFLLTVSLFWKC